jgi:cobalt-zinc-cadmium efflux system membrane fusion protein
MNNKLSSRARATALISILGAAIFAAGCQQPATDAPPRNATQAAAEKHGAEPVALTHFSDSTELFVEFAPLTVGAESAFAAHLTRLADYKPVTAGKLSITLSGGNQPDETFIVDAPTQPGIFRPVAKPRHAGVRHLVFRLDAAGLAAVHDLGSITVYADHEAAEKADAPDAPGSISYLKEQQWKTDYALTQIGKRPLRESVAATGTLRAPADRDALLNSITAGQVMAAGQFPRIGMQVRKGQLLAYLVPRLGGESDVATLDLAAQRARLDAQYASQERERLEALFKQEAVPEKRVQTARNQEKIARAELASAERRSGQYRSGAGSGIAIRAPITGSIAEVAVAPGAYINEGQPILHIVDSERLWLEVRIAESDVGRIGQPDGAAFSVDGFGQTFEIRQAAGGRVVGFGNLIDPTTRTAPLLFEFPNPDPRLRIGMAVRAQVFAGKAATVLAVPAAAVIDDNGQPVVYVQRTGEAFERRPVQLGTRDGDWVEILSGVASGERVVSKGAYQVRLAATAPAATGAGHAH